MEKFCLDDLARTILQNHSLSFQTFEEAKETLYADDGRIQYTYDRLSLFVYNHNLQEDDYSYLIKKLNVDYRKYHGKEEEKRRNECNVLRLYLSLVAELQDYLIEMETRPDFVLRGKKSVGIEVTEFTTQTDSVLLTICNQNFGRGLSAETIALNAIKKHGAKAKLYDFHYIHGTVVAGAGLQDINHNKEIYAEEIIAKYEKYKEKIRDYDEFIILCDACRVIGVLNEWDAEDIVGRAKRKSQLSDCTICILYTDEIGTLNLSTFAV